MAAYGARALVLLVALSVLASGESPCEPEAPGQYLLFELDHGALTNVYDGMLYAAEMACVTGRTLVLPPAGAVWMKDWGPNSPLDDRSGAMRMPVSVSRIEDYWALGGADCSLRAHVRVLSFQNFLRAESASLRLPWAAGVDEARLMVRSECESMQRQSRRLGNLYRSKHINASRPRYWSRRAVQLCATARGLRAARGGAAEPDLGQWAREHFWVPHRRDCPLGKRLPKRLRLAGAETSAWLSDYVRLRRQLLGRARAADAPSAAFARPRAKPTKGGDDEAVLRAIEAKVQYWPMDANFLMKGWEYPRLLDCAVDRRAHEFMRIRSALEAGVRPSAPIEHAWRAAAGALGGPRAYAALHYRTREFDLYDASDTPDALARRVLDILECEPLASPVAHAAPAAAARAGAAAAPARRSLYVATDAPTGWFAPPNGVTGGAGAAWPGGIVQRTRFWADVEAAARAAAAPRLARHAPPAARRPLDIGAPTKRAPTKLGFSDLAELAWAKLVSLVEGELIAHAALFVGTKGSTFSSRASRLCRCPTFEHSPPPSLNATHLAAWHRRQRSRCPQLDEPSVPLPRV